MLGDTDSDSSDRDPRVSFLALRHWRRLAGDGAVLNETVDEVCGAIVGLDRKTVEWPAIDGDPWRGTIRVRAAEKTRLLAAIVRRVWLPTRSLCG